MPESVLQALPTCELARRFGEVRSMTLSLAEPLSEADAQVQSMPDASPTKWHLAHTTWFFETFVLEPHEPGFRPHDAAYRVLFNSYYNGVGAQHARPQRGLVTRPGLAEVIAYRRAVDERVRALLERDLPQDASTRLTLGLHHEQQHQELILTDLLHLLSCNPLAPAYRRTVARAPAQARRPPGWVEFGGGRVEIGHAGGGFAFDNEEPRHARLLAPYALADCLVTQGEWRDFVEDGGYREARWWLAAGWDWVRANAVAAPDYWRGDAAGGWRVFTLGGEVDLDVDTPVAHVSLYEADAYAHWRGAQTRLPCRLPTEFEWEAAAAKIAPQAVGAGNFLESGLLCARAAGDGPGLRQMFGDLWEWTRSAYEPYPGYRPWPGAVGEYNGKFMIDQHVLRGGSLATPASHIRASYRNFFPAPARWQFSGLRLARDLEGDSPAG
jgi:ergothioneine biosynthesis protein EgtB